MSFQNSDAIIVLTKHEVYLEGSMNFLCPEEYVLDVHTTCNHACLALLIVIKDI